MVEMRKIERALISVSDKAGLSELAAVLAGFGVEIVSTGGTAGALRASGLTVTDVAEITGFPEMMDGRVKTLHPKIHGALLGVRHNADHLASMHNHGISPIDLLVVNLYPFERTIAKEGVSVEEAIENIDIGGPAMIRSAAKNWRSVAVVTKPEDYPDTIRELRANDGSISLETKARLAAEAYALTSEYDRKIAEYLSQEITRERHHDPLPCDAPFGESYNIYLGKVRDLRYGENPHQRAALYTADETDGIANAEQIHGKEMSFNNYLDADAAWDLVNDFDELAVAIIKHTNPSGVGVGTTVDEAYARALATDPVSAFGGIVAFNRKVDAKAARSVIEIFSEVVIAPEFDYEAIEILKTKKHLRILRAMPEAGFYSKRQYRQISGSGFLVQEADRHHLNESDIRITTDRRPTDDEVRAMMLGWSVCKHVKSNAIVLANETGTLGVGAGQMNRIDSVRIAAMRAERFGLTLKGSALASDAFFPFRENVDQAAQLGITAIIQPGGSIKDDESIAAANEHGIAMLFTDVRHFKH
ncbi:MAG TPA: bifunctional phosphoribosylaminoimidazolecarboxamide formyltransferase/IMP cyclohydrolase [Pyrinomonadaceae bacterium]|nr:bifunctional phosphoribosylaminoimidazolecarboxamide formyltransferase/IMP cyclohydrolase [Pyrinomonadaceae bacterium]